MRLPRWIPFSFALITIAVALSATAQNSSGAHRRAVSPTGDEITILQTTDLHHHANGSDHVGLDVDPINGTSVNGAYARIAAYVGFVRNSTTHPVILVDSGDWTMGTLYDLTLASRPLALAFLDAMGYDAVTLGNHEFDYTPRGLARILSRAQSSFAFKTPIVASNMDLQGNADLAPYFGVGKAIQPSYVKQLSNGLKIGFIGLMGEAAALDSVSSPVTFTPLSAGYTSIQSLVDDLRNTSGAQIVIALSHSGTNAAGTSGEDVALARNVRGINVIASGHTHTPLASAIAVSNGNWTTQIIDAGAYGTNVARLDLRISRASGESSAETFNNVAMTDSSLASMRAGLAPDVNTTALIHSTDLQLNGSLAPVLSQFFSDYDPATLGKGIYHPVGTAAQTMMSNAGNAVPSPNGLGDLVADSVRNVPNAIIARTLAAIGGKPENLPGYDFTAFQAGVVATGVLRGRLPSGVPLTFADVYDVLPLGISPDATQSLPVGFPLMSVYVDPGDFTKITALQLVAQGNLVAPDFYVNLSGVQYSLKPAETYTYFKYATAAAVLQLTADKLAAGSTVAAEAVRGLFALATDRGAALSAAALAGNPYAAAMIALNDTSPDSGQSAANLSVMGEVGSTAVGGTRAVSALVLAKAIAAIDHLSGFASTDSTNVGAVTELSSASRIRVAVDLYALLLLNAVQSQYGITITPYQAATGTTTLTTSDLPTLLGNRIDAAPSVTGVQELKEWMALLSNVATNLTGVIGPQYASTPNFTEFPSSGAAVQTRNSTYPLASIGQLVRTVSALRQAP
jgi:2',3'-cyclic-nucleotide 2'-phosphodiesterase (5'-nucleotidase family)